MIAKNPGIIPQAKLGLEIIVKPQREEIQNEVKRIGYLKDREQPFQVRVGDQFLLYISKSAAWKILCD